MESIRTDSVAALRGAMDAAWGEFLAAMGTSESRWEERILESEGPEEAWSPRLAAWHVVAGELVRASYARHVLAQGGEPGMDMMEYAASGQGEVTVDALREEFRATKTPEQMRAAAARAREGSTALLATLTDGDLGKAATVSRFVDAYLAERGQDASNTVGGLLMHGVVHLRDHAAHMSRSMG